MKRWKSSDELAVEIKSIEYTDKLYILFGLSVFCKNAFYQKGFSLDARWSQAIELTDYGIEFDRSLQSSNISLDDETKHFVFFQLFYHNDLFIDHDSTDIDAVLNLVSEMHALGIAKWPYVFGNKLYHKFNSSPFACRTDYLEPEHVNDLLEDTPQGVFQIGKLVSGPLGFHSGQEERIIPPRLEVPLWHCSDPGCRARHLVRFRQFSAKMQNACNIVQRYFLDNFGLPSEWRSSLLNSASYFKKWPNGRPFVDIPALLSDCVIGNEKTALLIRSFESEHNQILTSVARNAGKKWNSIEDLASNVSTEEQHQLLLLLPDKSIIRFLDELIAARKIDIPPSELRRPWTYSPDRSKDKKSRVSNLGISSRSYPPVVELAVAIWSSYKALNLTDDLHWRLREYETRTPRHSVMEYIRNQGPQSAVKNLILTSRDVTTSISEKYDLTMFPGENEDNLIERLLWKLGFNLPRYDDAHQIFRDRIAAFESCVLKLGNELSEEDKARVRSIGVNLFVSVEWFLEELVSYNAWLLISDHFGVSAFQYTSETARLSVEKALGPAISSGTESFKWSVDGENTLGCLLSYLQAYLAWLKDREHRDPKAIQRPKDSFPHNANDPVMLFPFKHTELWADIPAETFAAYTDIFNQLCTQLAQADLPGIRNSLDHKRSADAFPTPNRMLACVSRLRQVMELCDQKRLIPKLYWATSSNIDSYGNCCDTFQDYRGTSVVLWRPPLSLPRRKKNFGVPCIIAPLDLLNYPNSMITFNVISISPYSEYWTGYAGRGLSYEKEVLVDPELDFK